MTLITWFDWQLIYQVICYANVFVLCHTTDNTNTSVAAAIESLNWLLIVFLDSAINAENGQANKVRNVVSGETGAVPAVARFYKVLLET